MSYASTEAVATPAVRFRHEALLYSGLQEFVESAAAFVRSALAAAEPILVAVIEPRASMLRAELGADADWVRFLDMAEVGRNPARIIPAWQDWVDEHVSSGRSFRGIGEPIWTGRNPAEIVECQQHEQLLNTAFDEGPGWWLLCPYDTSRLSRDIVARAHDTHPSYLDGLDGGPCHASASYPHPEMSPEALLASPLPAPAGPVHRLAFDRAGLSGLRRSLAHLASPFLGDRRTCDLVVAVNELAANSVLYGGGCGTVDLWYENDRLLCEVRDDGVIKDPLVGRRRPPGVAAGGAGLWIANQLCDLVQIRSAPGVGTAVRVHMNETGCR